MENELKKIRNSLLGVRKSSVQAVFIFITSIVQRACTVSSITSVTDEACGIPFLMSIVCAACGISFVKDSSKIKERKNFSDGFSD